MPANTTALAILGYMFTYWHTKQTDQRKANIERINEQLRELYGPLLARVTATQSAYTAMVRSSHIEAHDTQTHNQAFRAAITGDPRGPEAESYRHWMATVLQPLNEEAADVIVKRIDLLESDSIKQCLLRFVAHVSSNRVVLQEWEKGNLDAHSAIPYPDELVPFVQKQFALMKERQAKLLNVKMLQNVEDAPHSKL